MQFKDIKSEIIDRFQNKIKVIHLLIINIVTIIKTTFLKNLNFKSFNVFFYQLLYNDLLLIFQFLPIFKNVDIFWLTNKRF